MNHFSRIVLVFGFLIVHLHNAHGDDGRKQRPAAPGTGDQTTEQSLTTPFRQLTQLEIRLQQELHVARSQGDLQNVRRLESLLLQSHPTPNPQPVNTESPVVVTPADFPSIAPEWGNDVLVRTGVVGISSRRMIAQDVRSNGEIYVATVFEGSTADTVYLFRSNNNGVSWNWFVGFWNGRKMQSILQIRLVEASSAFSIHIRQVAGWTGSSRGLHVERMDRSLEGHSSHPL
jgi:hypothetical protein